MAVVEKSLSGSISAVKMSGSLNTETGASGTLNMAERVYENDYEKLHNKPKINGVELVGNQSFDDLGMSELTALDVFNILNKIWEE